MDKRIFKFTVKTDTNIYTEEVCQSEDIMDALRLFINNSSYSIKDIEHIIEITL